MKNQKASLRNKEIARIKKEIRELKRMTVRDEESGPRVISDVPVKTNIVLMDETQRTPVPVRGKLPSVGTAASASELEEIDMINKQISELAARRRALRNSFNSNRGRLPILGSERERWSWSGDTISPRNSPSFPRGQPPPLERREDRYVRRWTSVKLDRGQCGAEPIRLPLMRL